MCTGEGVWVQRCELRPMEQRDPIPWVSAAWVRSVRGKAERRAPRGGFGMWQGLGLCNRCNWGARPHKLGTMGDVTALVPPMGQGIPARTLGVAVGAGQCAVLAAGTAGLRGTQVTNWTVNILRWLWFIVQIRSAEKILGDRTKRQAAWADKWTDHFVLRNNL